MARSSTRKNQERPMARWSGFLIAEIRQSDRACGDAWLNDCPKDWDTETHMSRQEYARTCQRVAKERIKALIDDAVGRNPGE